jgi:hypothetical protein
MPGLGCTSGDGAEDLKGFDYRTNPGKVRRAIPAEGGASNSCRWDVVIERPEPTGFGRRSESAT